MPIQKRNFGLYTLFMQIGVLGINHKLATLALRERLIKGNVSALPRHTLHYVSLITCNRFEIYFSSKDLAATQSLLLQFLCEESEEEIGHKFYSYFREDCFLHLARVTAGLDSAILFETEIQGQVKRAYQQAALERALSPEIHYLFQKSLALGKRVRSHYPATETIFSLEESVESMALAHLGTLKEKKLLFVGISEINFKVASYLKQQEPNIEITFCNRSLPKRVLPFPLYDLSHLTLWSAYDMSIFGTSSLDYLLDRGDVPPKSHLMIDLSVPRNVNPEIAYVKGVTLVNIEQLHKWIERKRRGQVEELARIEGEEIMQGVLALAHAFGRKRGRLPQFALVG